MEKMTVEPSEKIVDEPLYKIVAEKAEVDPEVARAVLVALRQCGYTIATPRVQWRH